MPSDIGIRSGTNMIYSKVVWSSGTDPVPYHTLCRPEERRKTTRHECAEMRNDTVDIRILQLQVTVHVRVQFCQLPKKKNSCWLAIGRVRHCNGHFRLEGSKITWERVNGLPVGKMGKGEMRA